MSADDDGEMTHSVLLKAIRDGYEKLFWKVNLQAAAFRNAQRLNTCESNGSSEVIYFCFYQT
jgi:hypothetical protein